MKATQDIKRAMRTNDATSIVLTHIKELVQLPARNRPATIQGRRKTVVVEFRVVVITV